MSIEVPPGRLDRLREQIKRHGAGRAELMAVCDHMLWLEELILSKSASVWGQLAEHARKIEELKR